MNFIPSLSDRHVKPIQVLLFDIRRIGKEYKLNMDGCRYGRFDWSISSFLLWGIPSGHPRYRGVLQPTAIVNLFSAHTVSSSSSGLEVNV